MKFSSNRLSIVIATLGNKTLSETINCINNNDIIPHEILIVIPENESKKILQLQNGNVKIIPVQVRGQVAQRCEGFKASKGEIIIQMDDDIILEHDTISKLLEAFNRLKKNTACAPAFYFKESGNSAYKNDIPLGCIMKIYYFFLNGFDGYKEGEISKAGTEIGVNPFGHSNSIVETQWLPGGMVLHHRDNLILNNYFPFSGKAYSEDLFHSAEMKKNGINLYVILNSKAWISDPRSSISLTIFEWISNLKKDLITRLYFVRITNRSVIRMYVYYVFVVLSFIFKKIKNR